MAGKKPILAGADDYDVSGTPAGAPFSSTDKPWFEPKEYVPRDIAGIAVVSPAEVAEMRDANFGLTGLYVGQKTAPAAAAWLSAKVPVTAARTKAARTGPKRSNRRELVIALSHGQTGLGPSCK